MQDQFFKDIKRLFYSKIDILSPFGSGNPEPKFVIENLKIINSKIEWNRIKDILKKIDKKKVISLDTRKSDIMEKGINLGIKLINDVSGLNYDKNSIYISF